MGRRNKRCHSINIYSTLYHQEEKLQFPFSHQRYQNSILMFLNPSGNPEDTSEWACCGRRHTTLLPWVSLGQHQWRGWKLPLLSLLQSSWELTIFPTLSYLPWASGIHSPDYSSFTWVLNNHCPDPKEAMVLWLGGNGGLEIAIYMYKPFKLKGWASTGQNWKHLSRKIMMVWMKVCKKS